MSVGSRKKLTIHEMYAALIAMGHEKLWFCRPTKKGRKSGVCQIVTWDNYVVAERHLDVHTKGWDVTKRATYIFPYVPGSEPSQFDDELDESSLFMLQMLY